jgi:hypothetical protein
VNLSRLGYSQSKANPTQAKRGVATITEELHIGPQPHAGSLLSVLLNPTLPSSDENKRSLPSRVAPNCHITIHHLKRWLLGCLLSQRFTLTCYSAATGHVDNITRTTTPRQVGDIEIETLKTLGCL